MGKFIDLTGTRFNMLTVIERVGTDSSGRVLWKCICDCGNETVVPSYCLTSGHTKSCGCLLINSHITHGQSYSHLYQIWHGMKNRCINPNMQDYSRYGGRGITVCDEWDNNYESFQDWALDNGYSEDLTIDRIDPNGNYEPDNCRWSTKKEQANNRVNNLYYSMNGENHTLSEWCDMFNLPYQTIYARIHRYNWDFITAITTPLNI